MFAYGTASTFPTGSYASSNYWVDAIFDTQGVPATAPTVVSETPADNATGVSATAAITATFSAPLSATPVFDVGDITGLSSGAAVPGNTVYDAATRTATFTPTTQFPPNTVIGVSVTSVDAWGQHQAQEASWTFTSGTTPAPTTCPCSLFGPGDVPAVVDATGDPNPVELGMRFTPQVDGTVTGVRFYKGPLNTGTHTGSLWNTIDDTQLATGTFTNETASGWQTLLFTTPVPVQAGTTYVVSYHAPNGEYAYTASYFGDLHYRYPIATDRAGPPQRVASMYAYGTSTVFPQNGSSSGTNYWVDVVFTPSG